MLNLYLRLLAELWSYCPPQSITEETESNIDFEIQIHRITEGKEVCLGPIAFLKSSFLKTGQPNPQKVN